MCITYILKYIPLLFSHIGPQQIEEQITSQKNALKHFEEKLNLNEEKFALYEQILDQNVQELAQSKERILHLEEIIKTNILRSCAEYASFGVTKNGHYTVDPDGQRNGKAPIQVYCKFQNGTGITEIEHNAEHTIEIDKCAEISCFKQQINYSIPTDQIAALKELSEECQQSIKFGCYSAPLYDYVTDNYLGGWLDYNSKLILNLKLILKSSSN